MKILQVRLENLNSLRGVQTVCLDEAPLSEVGLFAITGPTGAGKSTLLDAITLALFGRASRYGNEPNPEGMMSRDTGSCRAEVLFEVPTRGRFTATWELRRARGRADGNLQPPRRYIYDADGQLIAESIRAADEMILELIGLDYDRFLRSAMLAQGEFARFLKASSGEQAQLLESLTATSIYSELGKLCYEESKRRDKELTAREEAAGHVMLLSPEARQEKQSALKLAVAEQATGRDQAERLTQQLAKAESLARAIARNAALELRQEALEAERAAAADDLQRLSLHHQTAPFASDLQGMLHRRQRLDEERQNLTHAQARLQVAQTAWWTALTAARDEADAQVSKAQQAVVDAQHRVQQLQVEQAETDQWLAAHAVDAGLEDALPELARALGQLATTRQEEKRARQALQKLRNQLPELEQHVSAAEQVTRNSAQLRQTMDETCRAAAAAHRDTVAAGDEQALQQARDAIRERHTKLTRLKDMIGEGKRQAEAYHKLQQQLAELVTSGQTLIQQQQATQLDLENAERELSLRRDHHHKSQLIANFEQQRQALQEGTECPLCGSMEHPFAIHGTGDISPDELAAAVKAAEKTVTQARAAVTKSGNALAALQSREAALKESIQGVSADLQERRSAVRELANHLELTILTDEEIDRQRDAAEGDDEALKLRLGQIQAARKLADEAKERLDAADKANVQATTKLEQATTARQNHLQRFGEQQTLVEAHQQQVQELGSQVTSLLAPYTLETPAENGETAMLKLLSERWRSYQAGRQKMQELRTMAERAAEAVSRAEQAHEESGRLAKERQLRLNQANVDVTRIKADAVADLRQNCASPAEIDREEQTRREAASVARDAAERAGTDFENADAAHANARDALQERLATTQFEDIEALQQARLPDETAQQVEQLDADLRSRRDTLAGELTSLTSTIDELRAEQVAEGDAVEPLKQERDAVVAANEQRGVMIGSLQRELQEDDRNRTQHQQEMAAIATDREKLQTWKQLQGLIGSADGKRFREFAQGISLEILTQHANRHLQRLSDRYQIRRRMEAALDLEIEDLFHAGATRAMASLSGGETFLVSLALALGLADLAGRNVRIESLFIDEGFGALDSQTVDIAIAALEALQQDSKTIGVISHVDLLKERIGTQICVEKTTGSSSQLRIVQL